ncbi:MAG: formyltetrahydrofolate deformylase [Gammaproteobacteria bacterium 39-13]|nr:formyltetrahydrofolate deformylase [Gammaproteobacteria bacterium]OJV89033.1 MAG: formyltetrahydrofolate deformylase [Gammaproteobacteria bacterium 39-13]
MKYTDLSTVARLLITCPDRPGIIARVSTFLKDHGANITDLDQHSTDPEGGTFFMRLEFQTPHLDLSSKKLELRFGEEVGTPFNMDWQLHYAANLKRMAVLVSKYDHALLEVLWRWSRQELPITIPFIISNHPDLKAAAAHFNVPFYHIPVTADSKVKAEEEILKLCEGKVDGIVLARYMQILSDDFITHYPNKIINIHHSFLPAFIGANPYQQAYDKGVKLIGATAHYVTKDLDMGPIIAQDVVRVNHRLSAAKLKELGQYVERTVLARAIKSHVEDRIIVDGNKTVVFDLE